MSGRRAPGRSHPGLRTQLISDFYAAQAERLRAKVVNKTGAPADVVADACQTAWAILLRRPDISLDARGLSWLTAVAVHEVYRQWRDRAHNLPMGALSLGTDDPGELSSWPRTATATSRNSPSRISSMPSASPTWPRSSRRNAPRCF